MKYFHVDVFTKRSPGGNGLTAIFPDKPLSDQKCLDIGLPLGIQFMASKGWEDLLFYIGKQLENKKLFKLPKAYDAS